MRVVIDADAVSSGNELFQMLSAWPRLQGTFQKVVPYGDNVYAYEPNVFSKAETGTEIKALGYLSWRKL